jgi:hypothetical protein
LAFFLISAGDNRTTDASPWRQAWTGNDCLAVAPVYSDNARMDEKREQLRGLWAKWDLPHLVSLPDAQPHSQAEIMAAGWECHRLFWEGSVRSPMETARSYAETLILNGWTDDDAEEAVTAAILNYFEH